MKRQISDVFFSLALLTIFVVCSAMVLLFQASSYQRITQQNEQSEQQQLAIAYLQRQLRTHDRSNAFQVQEFDGVSCLVISDEANQQQLYLYVYEGALQELYLHQGANVSLQDGVMIAEVQAMSIVKDAHTLAFQLQYESGQRNIIYQIKSY